MENSKQLAQRFREVMLDGKWIANTNYKDQLSQMEWRLATQKVGSLNTIAALTFHINYYIKGILDFFETGHLEIRDKFSFDHGSFNSQEDWGKLLDELWRNAEKFALGVEGFSNEQLETVFVKEEYGSYRRNIEGVIEHCYYHLGQVSLIRKFLNGE